ncbi:hypothetical protein IPN35_02515 [Candidatus Peregrinibacteria bacterium]|nr:MAG: hypothetical protein IPN35_02515 [Candidatus Peregrinibacteria bacterium]
MESILCSLFLSLLFSFCGGVFGAAFGALTAFIIFGTLILLSTLTSNEILVSLALGEFFGPHTAFAGGVAAAAYAAHKKLRPENGKNLITPLLFSGNLTPLVVGGIFGVIGFLIQYLLLGLTGLSVHLLPERADAIAGSIFVSAILVRILFSNTPILNKKSFVLREKSPHTKNGIWLPWETDWKLIIFLGIFFGVLFSSISLKMNNPFFGFGLSAFLLLFLHFGTHIPVTHHIALPAGTAALLSGNLFLGVIFGVLGGILGEIAARFFYNGGDTHIDPPAFAIFVCSLFFWIL